MIFFILIFLLIWSWFGKVDEVATARGRIIPKGDLKIIQVPDQGIIKKIYVREGDRVNKGDLLVELDSTIKKVDITELETNLEIATLEKEISLSELNNDKFIFNESKFKHISQNKISTSIKRS